MAKRIPGVQLLKKDTNILPAQATMGSTIPDIPGGQASAITAQVVDSSRQNVAQSVANNRKVTAQASEALSNAAGMPRAFVQAGAGLDISGLVKVGTELYETAKRLEQERANKEFAAEAETFLQNIPDTITKDKGGITAMQRQQAALFEKWLPVVGQDVLLAYLNRITNTSNDISNQINKRTYEERQKEEDALREVQVHDAVFRASGIISGLNPLNSPSKIEASYLELDKFYSDVYTEHSPIVANRIMSAVYTALNENMVGYGNKRAELLAQHRDTADFYTAFEPFHTAYRESRIGMYELNAVATKLQRNFPFARLSTDGIDSFVSDLTRLQERELQAAKIQKDAAIANFPIEWEQKAAIVKFQQDDWNRVARRMLDYPQSQAYYEDQLNLLSGNNPPAAWAYMTNLVEQGRKFREEEPKDYESVMQLQQAVTTLRTARDEDLLNFGLKQINDAVTVASQSASLGAALTTGIFSQSLAAFGLNENQANLTQAARDANVARLASYKNELIAEAERTAARARAAYDSSYRNNYSGLISIGWVVAQNGRYSLVSSSEYDKQIDQSMSEFQQVFDQLSLSTSRAAETSRTTGTSSNFR